MLTVALFAASSSACADEFYTFVRYRCNVQADQLIVEHFGAYDEVGKELASARAPDTWQPGQLRGMPPNDPVFASRKTVKRVCALSDGPYTFELKPVPENFRNIQGRCGAWETGQVTLRKAGTSILQVQLDSSCLDESAPVITRIVIKAQALPAITRVSQNAFFR